MCVQLSKTQNILFSHLINRGLQKKEADSVQVNRQYTVTPTVTIYEYTCK